jgi:hypothetical protein
MLKNINCTYAMFVTSVYGKVLGSGIGVEISVFLQLLDHIRPFIPVHLMNVFEISFKKCMNLTVLTRGWGKRGEKGAK